MLAHFHRTAMGILLQITWRIWTFLVNVIGSHCWPHVVSLKGDWLIPPTHLLWNLHITHSTFRVVLKTAYLEAPDVFMAVFQPATAFIHYLFRIANLHHNLPSLHFMNPYWGYTSPLLVLHFLEIYKLPVTNVFLRLILPKQLVRTQTEWTFILFCYVPRPSTWLIQ